MRTHIGMSGRRDRYCWWTVTCVVGGVQEGLLRRLISTLPGHPNLELRLVVDAAVRIDCHPQVASREVCEDHGPRVAPTWPAGVKLIVSRESVASVTLSAPL